MRKIELKKWKNLIICMAAVITIFTVLKPLPVYAGDPSAATALSTNGTWSKKYTLAKGDTDYYKFTISTAGKVDIKLMAYERDLDCNLWDHNLNGIKGMGASGTETSPRVESKTLWLSQGTYYLTVSSKVNVSGNYQLFVDFTSSGTTAAEQDSYSVPRNMPLNRKVTSVLTTSNQEDWYKTTLTSAGKYRHIGLRSDGSNGKCYLYDSNLTELSIINHYGSSEETKELYLKPGTYYVKVSGTKGGIYICQLNEVIPAKGDILSDAKNQAQYKVTKAGKSGGTVTYQKTLNNAKNSVTIPATVKIDNITYKVTGIAAGAWKGNSGLKKVTIGKNVTSIGASAFSGCTRLKSITIPANVDRIGKKAFYNCKTLKTINIKTKKLTASKVGTNAFKGIYKKAVIKVPGGKFKAYKSMLKKRGAGTKTKYKKLS